MLSTVILLVMAMLMFGSSVVRHAPVPETPAAEQSELRSDPGTYFDHGLLPKEISTARGATPRTGETLSAPRTAASSFSAAVSRPLRAASFRPVTRAGQPLYCIYESYLI